MRKRVAAAVAAVVTVVGASGCGAASTTVAGTPTVDRLSVPAVPKAATGHFRDGGLQFDVLDVSQIKQVGDPKEPGLSITARGVFVVVTMSIRNVSSELLTFFDRCQTLVDSSGEKFAADMAADIYGNRSIRSTRIDPGNDV